MTDFLDYANINPERTDIESKVSSAFVDVSVKLDRPPVAISIGEYTMGLHTYPISFGTYGNFSVIVGASKSKKTFLKSMITAIYIGGNMNRRTSLIRGHKEKEMFVIDIDTEQSLWHAQNVFKRVTTMVGCNSEFYKPYSLRPYSHKERVEIIEYLLYESEYKDNVGLVCIDGIADLIADFNNVEEANMIVQKLMKWTDDKQCHLNTIIHQNSSSGKATGHLGSFLLKKAETICNVDNQDGEVVATFPYTRGFPIADFRYQIDANGLPYIIGELPDIPEEKTTTALKPNENFDEPF